MYIVLYLEWFTHLNAMFTREKIDIMYQLLKFLNV